MNSKFSPNNKWPLAAAALAGLLLAPACQKERDVFIPFSKTVDALRGLLTGLATDPAASVAVLDIDGSSNQISLTTPRGIVVSMDGVAGLFADENGLPVGPSAAAKITVEATDVFEKPEFTGLGTVTQKDFGQPLETFGMLKIEAFQNGKPLKLRDDGHFLVHIPVGPTGYRPDVFLHEGGWSSSATEVKFRWSQAADIAAPSVQFVPDGATYYQLGAKKLGWLAANRELEPNPQGPLTVKLGSEFSLTNTLGFLVLKGSKSVLPLKYGIDARLFLNERVPGGQAARLVFAAKIGEELFLATRDITTEGGALHDLSADMKPTTEAAIEAALKDLK